MADYGLGCDSSDSGYDIVRRQAFCLAFLDQFMGKCITENFATSPARNNLNHELTANSRLRFRRAQLKIWQGQEIVNEILVHFPSFTHVAVLVVFLFTICKVAYDSIYKDVPRTRCKVLTGRIRKLVFRKRTIKVIACVYATFTIRWDETYVSNPTDVLTRA